MQAFWCRGQRSAPSASRCYPNGTIIGLTYFKGRSLSRYLKYITISISITRLPPYECDNIFEIICVSSFNVWNIFDPSINIKTSVYLPSSLRNKTLEIQEKPPWVPLSSRWVNHSPEFVYHLCLFNRCRLSGRPCSKCFTNIDSFFIIRTTQCVGYYNYPYLTN